MVCHTVHACQLYGCLKSLQQPPKTLLVPTLTWNSVSKFCAVYCSSRYKLVMKIRSPLSRWTWVRRTKSLSPFWILLELTTVEVVVTTGAIKRPKLQSNRHHQQTNTKLFTRRMPFLLPNQQCQSTEWRSPRMSPFWILLGLRTMETVVSTGAVRRAKLQSNHQHQQTNAKQ